MTESLQGSIQLDRVEYTALNARQKETYNFQKVAARLGEYGYNCILLSDDWLGADFIAYHHNGQDFYRIQLKGRLTLESKYEGRDLHIAFLDGDRCYVYPHDALAAQIEAAGRINESVSWSKHRSYSWPSVPKWVRSLIAPYEVLQ